MEEPSQDLIDKAINALASKGRAQWLLGALLAFVLAFATGILQTNYYSDPPLRFGSGFGWLSLLGLWLLSYWTVTLTVFLWKRMP